MDSFKDSPIIYIPITKQTVTNTRQWQALVSYALRGHREQQSQQPTVIFTERRLANGQGYILLQMLFALV